jgi:hypothetical protein
VVFGVTRDGAVADVAAGAVSVTVTVTGAGAGPGTVSVTTGTLRLSVIRPAGAESPRAA